MVIAVINIVIVCFVYNNTATHNSNIVLQQVGEEKDHEEKHVNTNKTPNKHDDKNVSNLHEQVSEIQKTLKSKDKSAIAKLDANRRDETINISRHGKTS